MAKDILNEQVDSAIEEWTDSAVTELKNQGKTMADKAIQAVSEEIQKKFLDNIEDEALKQAASGTLKKLSSVDGLIGAFNSIQGNSGLLHQTCGEIGRDIEKFIGGKMTRADLMESMAKQAEIYISDSVEKMATTAAAEFGTMAPVIGKIAGHIAATLFREAVAPFLNAARRAQMAREKYEQLHGLYEEAIAQAKMQRQEFIEAVSEIFEQQEQLIAESLDKLDAALSLNNHKEATAALNNIAAGIGGQELEVKSPGDLRDRIKKREKLVM